MFHPILESLDQLKSDKICRGAKISLEASKMAIKVLTMFFCWFVVHWYKWVYLWAASWASSTSFNCFLLLVLQVLVFSSTIVNIRSPPALPTSVFGVTVIRFFGTTVEKYSLLIIFKIFFLESIKCFKCCPISLEL